MIIGVLAIQGDFEAHAHALHRVGVNAVEVRRAKECDAVDGLIIPGGESTTMLKFIEEDNLAEPLTNFARRGKPVLGTCAGAILLAREVYNPAQPSLAVIDIAVERNGYGRQVDSFVAVADFDGNPLDAVFIRAPKIRRVGRGVNVLATLNDEAVLVREGNVLAATFHPELTEDDRVHRLLVEMVRSGSSERDPRCSLNRVPGSQTFQFGGSP